MYVSTTEQTPKDTMTKRKRRAIEILDAAGEDQVLDTYLSRPIPSTRKLAAHYDVEIINLYAWLKGESTEEGTRQERFARERKRHTSDVADEMLDDALQIIDTTPTDMLQLKHNQAKAKIRTDLAQKLNPSYDKPTDGGHLQALRALASAMAESTRNDRVGEGASRPAYRLDNPIKEAEYEVLEGDEGPDSDNPGAHRVGDLD